MEEETKPTQTQRRYKTFEEVYDDGLDMELVIEEDYDIPCLSFCDI